LDFNTIEGKRPNHIEPQRHQDTKQDGGFLLNGKNGTKRVSLRMSRPSFIQTLNLNPALETERVIGYSLDRIDLMDEISPSG